MPESESIRRGARIPVPRAYSQTEARVIAGLGEDGALGPLAEELVAVAEGTEVAGARCAGEPLRNPSAQYQAATRRSLAGVLSHRTCVPAGGVNRLQLAN